MLMNIKLYHLRLFFISITILSGCKQESREEIVSESIPLKNWAWTYVREGLTDIEWKQKFDTMKMTGIDGILLLRRANDNSELERVSRIGKKSGLEMHIWITFLNPHGGDSIEEAHPEWYVVSRNGESSLDKPPYVPYYKWLCPSRPEVQQFLVKVASDIAKKDYVDGVHLDYIRYPDVILPVGIQPRYDLVQDKEYPEFDFCYCEVCRENFKQLEGIDPISIPDPSTSDAWKNYRYQTVTDLVNLVYDEVHRHNKKLTAAVFPTPELAKELVRQDWTNWKIDAVMPMMYHQYYYEEHDWIEQATSEGKDLLPDSIPLYSGLFINEIKPEEFQKVVDYAIKGGGNGICLFNSNGMTSDQWVALQKALGK